MIVHFTVAIVKTTKKHKQSVIIRISEKAQLQLFFTPLLKPPIDVAPAVLQCNCNQECHSQLPAIAAGPCTGLLKLQRPAASSALIA